MGGSSLYKAKRSDSAVVRTNLLSPLGLTHAEGGMESAGLKSVSSFNHQTPT